MGKPLQDNRPLDLNSDHDPAALEALQQRAAGGSTLMVRAFGVSMHPFIRNGEIIAVRATALDQLSPGDVIFFHHKNRLYAHRLIKWRPAANTVEEGLQLVTKGDSLKYADEPIAPSQIIGKVVAVCRGDEIVSLDSRRLKLTGKLIGKFSFLYGTLFDYAFSLRGRWISRMARFRIYRGLRKRLPGMPISYRPYRPEDLDRFAGLLADGSPTVSFDELRGIAQRQVDEIAARNGTLFIAERGRAMVGAFQGGQGLLEKEFGIPGWWIMGLYVRATQRGLGVGEGLTRALIARAKREGADFVYCNVFITNIPSWRMFEKIGFVRAEEVEEELNRGYQKISPELPRTVALKYALGRETGKETNG